MAAVECDSLSSRKSLRLKQLSSSAKRLKTSESSSENLKLGENPGDGETAQGKTKRNGENGQEKTQCIGKEADDISSNQEFPSHSQDELMKIYGERTQREAMLTFDSKGKTKRKRENGQAKTQCSAKEADDISSNLEFPSHSQDELMKIYGERTQRKAMLTFDSKELESSEEEEGISEEELEKTKGWKLLMKALDSKFEKKHQANP